MTRRNLTAIPAYGRDYATAEQVRGAWAAKRDFLIQDPFEHGYINIDDKPDDVILNIRYNKLRRVVLIRLGD